jgi:hypothetical protein
LRAWPDVHGEVLKLWAIAKERPMLFINRPGRIYHTSSGDNLTGARSTIRLAPRAVLGLEMLIAEHSAAWLEHCPATYGRYLFNLAFNQALANQEEAAAQSLLDAWRNHGPKLKIAAVGASLLVGSTLRQRLFLSAAQMRRAH